MAIRSDSNSVSGNDSLNAKRSAGYAEFKLGNGGYPEELDRAKAEIDKEFGDDCKYAFGHFPSPSTSSTLMAYPKKGGEYIVRYFVSSK
jgi:hypothetical protein